MNTADKIENHIRAIFGGIDVPSNDLLLYLYDKIFIDISLNNADNINPPSNEDIRKSLFPENIEKQMKLSFNSCVISFYIATSPVKDLNETQVEIRKTIFRTKDWILDPEQALRTTVFGIKQLLHYCRIIDKNDDKLTLKRDLIKIMLNLLSDENPELKYVDMNPSKQSMTKLFVLEPVKFDFPMTVQQELLQSVIERNKATAPLNLNKEENLTDVFAGKTVTFETQIFRTKLDEFTDKLIIEYETQNKDIFDDFNELKEFITKQIDQLIEKPKKDDFLKMKSGTFNHELSKLNKRTSEDDYQAKVYKNLTFKLRVSTEVGGKFPPTTQRLLNVLLSENTLQGDSPEFTLNISDYMQLCGLRSREKAIEQLTKDSKILFNSWFEWKETGANGQMRVIEKWDKTKDTMSIRIAPSFWGIYKKYPVGLISKKSLAISVRTNPNSQHFSFKITQHKNMNYGKPTENIISVKTLLEGSEIPSYEEVMENDKHIAQRIIEPFERDLDALKEDFTWEYCGKNGIPLTNEDASNLTYDVFIKLNIKISWKNFPDQTKRLEKKKQYIEEAQRKRIKYKTKKENAH